MKMRIFLIIIFLTGFRFLFGQENNTIFDNKTNLTEGVYTTLSEILENNPKYHDCLFESKVNVWTGKIFIYYTDQSGARNELKDTILLVVEDGKRYVCYKKGFYKLILTGAISTFIIETIDYKAMGPDEVRAKIYFWDVMTGKMDKLNPYNVDDIIKRDRVIYETYSDISDLKKSKTLYSYILKYNMHNPVFIK